jgi:DNA polymerase V
MFVLVDCNNFFVSCERLFRPDLHGKPVIVASSNDGCAIARSNEVKALGIPMGAPLFKYEDTIKAHGVTVFSANFELYGDISRRLAMLLTEVSPHIEVYSIDECFLDVSSLLITDYVAWAEQVRESALQQLGIPVSIGIGSTKTLAKLASELAKKKPNNITLLQPRDEQLRHIPLKDIWGIGWRRAPQIQNFGLTNAYDIALSDPMTMRRIFGSVNGERMQRELNGTVCYNVETSTKPQKMISATRTFGQDTNTLYELEAAVANLAARAAHNLRKDDQLASELHVFLATNRFKPGYAKTFTAHVFSHPTCHSGQIVTAANALVATVYNKNAHCHRAGVILTSLRSAANMQQQNFLDQAERDAQSIKNAQMHSIDQINKRYGKNTIHIASQDLSKTWQPQSKNRSPHYTTNWRDLPKLY